MDMVGYREFPILYVHDDPQAAVVLRYVLGEDFTVLSARELTEAIALAGENELGLVLCEQSALGIPGVEICARLRDVQPHVPRIVTTTHAGRQISVDAVQAGHIAGHVGKPWQHPEFVSLVRAKVDLVRMRAAMRTRQIDPRLVRAKRLAEAIVLDNRLEGSGQDARSGTDVACALRGCRSRSSCDCNSAFTRRALRARTSILWILCRHWSSCFTKQPKERATPKPRFAQKLEYRTATW